MGITVEQVETIAAKLRALPPIENKKRVVSKQESIRMLTGEIAALRERGYTLEQVAELLTADHLEIGAPTLKSYLQRSQTGSKKATGKRKTAAVCTPSSSSPQAKPADQDKPPAQTIGERAAALVQSPGNTTSAATAITRPDRSRI
jgi:hypothetical protein